MVRKLNEHNYNKYSHILAEDEEIDSLSQLANAELPIELTPLLMLTSLKFLQL